MMPRPYPPHQHEWYVSHRNGLTIHVCIRCGAYRVFGTEDGQ